MKIAVVGSGIAGLTVAQRLHRQHELTVFEAGDHVGGHTATVDVEVDGRSWAIDTGFIVFNEKTYPNFCAFLAELGVAHRESSMSFSVCSERSGVEYNGTSLNSLFCQRTNLFRPSFLKMVRDILRFYREAKELLAPGHEDVCLGPYLRERGYSKRFIEEHLNPMGAAVWSASEETMETFPAAFFMRFFENHGFLEVNDRPVWRVIEGGSREYVRALIPPFEKRIRLSTPVHGIEREGESVELILESGERERFDEVVLACHAPQALALLGEHATPAEREILSLFRTQENSTVLHTDERLLPRTRLGKASWNVHLPRNASERVQLTYWMNELQRLEPGAPNFLVTLNADDSIAPDKVLGRYVYNHPIFTPAAVRAQARHAEISGADRVHFAGAYWGYGFHEDGHRSGLEVASALLPEPCKLIPRPSHSLQPR